MRDSIRDLSLLVVYKVGNWDLGQESADSGFLGAD